MSALLETLRKTREEVATFDVRLAEVDAKISTIEKRRVADVRLTEQAVALCEARDGTRSFVLLGRASDAELAKVVDEAAAAETKATEAKIAIRAADGALAVLRRERQKILERRDPLRASIPGILNELALERFHAQTEALKEAARGYILQYETWLATMGLVAGTAEVAGVAPPFRPQDTMPMQVKWNMVQLREVQPDAARVTAAREQMTEEFRKEVAT
jgi:hypothetical protein